MHNLDNSFSTFKTSSNESNKLNLEEYSSELQTSRNFNRFLESEQSLELNTSLKI